eukprot:8291685-Pyramimonas_sp.AAC.1
MPLAALTRTPPLAASGFSDGTAVVVQAGLALAEPGVPGFANVMSGRISTALVDGPVRGGLLAISYYAPKSNSNGKLAPD